jgi:hypothetical protein
LSGPVFKFYAPGLLSGGTEGTGSRFHVLRSQTCFGRYRGRRVSFTFLRSRTLFGCYQGRCVPFSYFAHPESFSMVPMASAPVFMFCAPRLFLGVTEGVGARFQVLRSQTRFWRYRGRRVPFSCFALPDTFLTVPTASGPVDMFCAPELFLDVTDGVGSRFYVLRYRTRFGRYRGRRVLFTCFALPDSFWELPWASGLVSMFCAPRLFLGVTVGAGSSFHVLRSRTRFRRCQGRRRSFSSFALPETFLAVPRASGLVFMF